MAPEAHGRTYHSTAMLLPDARVLTSGSGEGRASRSSTASGAAQIYSPPYLYKPDGTPGARPRIARRPRRSRYGQTITVESAEAGSVRRGTLIRLSSVTHAFNRASSSIPWHFTATGATTLEAAGPANPNHAPPGRTCCS